MTLTNEIAAWQVIRIGLTMLQKLVMTSEQAGQALIPYYRQLLPVCSLFWGSGTRGARKGEFDYSQVVPEAQPPGTAVPCIGRRTVSLE